MAFSRCLKGRLTDPELSFPQCKKVNALRDNVSAQVLGPHRFLAEMARNGREAFGLNERYLAITVKTAVVVVYQSPSRFEPSFLHCQHLKSAGRPDPNPDHLSWANGCIEESG